MIFQIYKYHHFGFHPFILDAISWKPSITSFLKLDNILSYRSLKNAKNAKKLCLITNVVVWKKSAKKHTKAEHYSNFIAIPSFLRMFVKYLPIRTIHFASVCVIHVLPFHLISLILHILIILNIFIIYLRKYFSFRDPVPVIQVKVVKIKSYSTNHCNTGLLVHRILIHSTT